MAFLSTAASRWLMLCCMILPLHAEDLSPTAIKLTFIDLAEGHRQWEKEKQLPPTLKEALGGTVCIRGFLYRKEPELWVLAAEPNLKSCCIRAETQRFQQIHLIGDASKIDTSRAVTLQGTLSLSSDTPFAFLLSDFSIHHSDKNAFYPLLWLCLPAAALLVYIYLKRFVRR